MNNPFSRLKHYTISATDPEARTIEQQENHATECLAACLVFSSRIRNEFIRFLLNEAVKADDSRALDVVTQETIRGGYIDLVLRQTKNFVIALEVKVRSPENCDHHRNQLLRYTEWLNQQTEEPHRFLFTLVRNKDARFHPEQHGANGRETWRELYKRLKQMLDADDLLDVERSLIENFCDYLGNEAIVSTYELGDLLSDAAGLRARQAITSIFNQIGDRLGIEGFKTISVVDRKDYWPQLRVQNARWDSIFGEGENRKIALWFCVPGIWKANRHAFHPQIELWHEDHGNVWELAQPKLRGWLEALKSQNFRWVVFRSWRDQRENTPAEAITAEPRKIVALRDGDSVILNDKQFSTEDELINVLVARLKEYASLVDGLG
jgi:hypothetical protein